MKLGISASVLLTCFLIYLVFNLLKTNLLLKIGLSHMASIPGTAMALYVTGTTTDNMVLILLSFIAPAVLFFQLVQPFSYRGAGSLTPEAGVKFMNGSPSSQGILPSLR